MHEHKPDYLQHDLADERSATDLVALTERADTFTRSGREETAWAITAMSV